MRINNVWVILKCEQDEPSEPIGVREHLEDAITLIPEQWKNELETTKLPHSTKMINFIWYELHFMKVL